MAKTIHELIAAFGGVEDDQRYTRLVDDFADDAVYYDPFFGPQVGKPAIRTFMEHMEQVVPASGARFADWRVTAGKTCGYAEWIMVARNAAGDEVPVPGESLYRFRKSQVLGVVDYVDPVAYRKLRGDGGRSPNFTAGSGSLPASNSPAGATAVAIRSHVDAMTSVGRWSGTAELVDHAGDGDAAWAQWIFHGPHGDFAGWSLQRPTGRIRDFFDTGTAQELSIEPA